MLISSIGKLTLGKYYEYKAKRYLLAQGLRFVEANFFAKLGEIDLIFFEPATEIVVFVEVRYRAKSHFGGASASITKKKQDKIKKAALFYIAHRKIEPKFRFDVIAIDGNDINWIQSAFS